MAHAAMNPAAGEAEWRACKAGLTHAYAELARSTATELSSTLGACLSEAQIKDFGDMPRMVWEQAVEHDRRRVPRAIADVVLLQLARQRMQDWMRLTSGAQASVSEVDRGDWQRTVQTLLRTCRGRSAEERVLRIQRLCNANSMHEELQAELDDLDQAAADAQTIAKRLRAKA